MQVPESAAEDRLNRVRQSRKINVVLRKVEYSQPLHEPEGLGQGKPLAMQGVYPELLNDLENLIGLENIKELTKEIFALLQIGQYRTSAGLKVNTQVYHMMFKGNPGTGKTTVARILAKLFKSMGMLSKGHMIEVERADLVGEYIGHTALKTRELIKKALGGVLFIDEAYSLARGGEKDFGKEAIDALVKGMEDHNNHFILILAGYSEEMDDFLQTNPGLPSRFPIQLEFPDYTVDQLVQIAEKMVQEREYSFTPHTIQKLRSHLDFEKRTCLMSFSNARYVRNLIEKAIRHQAVRLLNQHVEVPSKQELMMIRPEDLKLEKKGGF